MTKEEENTTTMATSTKKCWLYSNVAGYFFLLFIFVFLFCRACITCTACLLFSTQYVKSLLLAAVLLLFPPSVLK